MRFGTLNAQIDGFWVVAHDSGELAAATDSYDITGLAGDTDQEYRLIARFVSNGSSVDYRLTMNNTGSGNYGWQLIRGYDSSYQASRATAQDSISLIGSALESGEIEMADVHFFVTSGLIKTANALIAGAIAGTTVDEIKQKSFVFNSTSEVTSIKIACGAANGIGVGTRFILLKKVHASDGMKLGAARPNQLENAWERIYSKTLTAAATSLVISNLEGDTDCVYRLVLKQVNGYAGVASVLVSLNSDTGVNYGFQMLYGQNTTVGASRNNNLTGIGVSYTNGISELCLSDSLIYAKSGYERTALISKNVDVNGTAITQIELRGESWNNTTDEVTSLLLTATNANGLGIGTTIELYRLNL